MDLSLFWGSSLYTWLTFAAVVTVSLTRAFLFNYFRKFGCCLWIMLYVLPGSLTKLVSDKAFVVCAKLFCGFMDCGYSKVKGAASSVWKWLDVLLVSGFSCFRCGCTSLSNTFMVVYYLYWWLFWIVICLVCIFWLPFNPWGDRFRALSRIFTTSYFTFWLPLWPFSSFYFIFSLPTSP